MGSRSTRSSRRTGVRRALRSEGPPRYRRLPRPSKLDPFKEEITRLLQQDARIPGKRIRELIDQLGYARTASLTSPDLSSYSTASSRLYVCSV